MKLTQTQARILLCAHEEGSPHVSYGNPEPLVAMGLLTPGPRYNTTAKGQALASRLFWNLGEVCIRQAA